MTNVFTLQRVKQWGMLLLILCAGAAIGWGGRGWSTQHSAPAENERPSPRALSQYLKDEDSKGRLDEALRINAEIDRVVGQPDRTAEQDQRMRHMLERQKEVLLDFRKSLEAQEEFLDTWDKRLQNNERPL